MKDQTSTKKVKRYSSYSEEFKQMVCQEYLKGGNSKSAIRSKYDIKSGTSIILDWLRKFGYIESDISKHPGNNFMAKPEKEKDTSKSLERENQDLKLQLEMYKRMIEIAEKEFKIPIVKKSDTK